jgi:general transcription factor 3C polypeptide 5 (transcription factor C subunit 1)
MKINYEVPKKLISVEYPGRVENADKMCDTLGGLEELSKGFQEKQKLQLKFRQNFFAKPVLSSEPLEASGMLLKVKVRKSRKHPTQKPTFVSTELLGTVSTSYKFNNFADYQYLPIQRNEKTGETENIYHDIIPKDITAGPSWLKYELIM